MPHVHLCRIPRTDFTEPPPWRPRVERVLHSSGVGWRENCLELAIPIPHHTSSHPRPLPCTTFSTRGTMRPCLEPTVLVPILHHTSSHATPCHAHTQPSLLAAPFAPSSSRQLRTPIRPFIEATITKLRASTLSCHPCSPVGSHAQCILRPPPVSSAAAPFVSRSTIRPFLEVTVPILHISTFSCRFDTPMHSRLAQLRLWRLHAPLPSRASPISDCLNLPPRHALPGSPVSSRTRLIPKWLPVRLLSCPARHSRPHAPLPRADCPNPLPRPHHMLLRLPDQLTCATAYPFSLLHQLLGFPARPLRPHAPRFALTAPPHQPLTPPRLFCRSQHECPSVIAPWTNARPWSLHALLRRADCPS